MRVVRDNSNAADPKRSQSGVSPQGSVSGIVGEGLSAAEVKRSKKVMAAVVGGVVGSVGTLWAYLRWIRR